MALKPITIPQIPTIEEVNKKLNEYYQKQSTNPVVAPNPAQPASLQGTMTTPRAPLPGETMVNLEELNKAPAPAAPVKTATSAPKPAAQVAQPGQPGAAPAAPVSQAPAAVDSAAFSKYIDTIQEKLKGTNDLANARALLITGLYDRPLTEEEKASLPEPVRKAIASGDPRDMSLQIRLLNDQIKGRTNTLDQGVSFLVNEYKDNLNMAEEKKQNAIGNVLQFAQVYGADAKNALTSLYGDTYMQELKNMGIDIDAFISTPTLAQRKGSGSGGGGSVDLYSGMSPEEQEVRSIILQNPGEYGVAADAIEAMLGKKIETGSKYDQWLRSAYVDGNDPSLLGADLNKLTATARAVMKNPSLFNTFTPTQKQKLTEELYSAGFDVDQLGTKPLSDGAIEKITQTDSAIANLQALRTTINDNLGYIGPLKGLQKINPWSGARKVQAEVDRVRQQVGKALEGGVLRKEDEEKYKKILAELTDTPSLALSKIDSMLSSLDRDKQAFVNANTLAGRNTSNFSNNSSSLADQVISKGFDYYQMKADGYSDQEIKSAVGL